MYPRNYAPKKDLSHVMIIQKSRDEKIKKRKPLWSLNHIYIEWQTFLFGMSVRPAALAPKHSYAEPQPASEQQL